MFGVRLLVDIACWLFLLRITWGDVSKESIQGGEYCDFETFEAECPDDHVIVMKHALYGRMKLGRCVVADLGYVGCSASVLDLADHRCSGKRHCSIAMPDKAFAIRQPCLTELKSYFEASYTCQKVTAVESRMCRRCDFVKVTSEEGYIASVLTEETGCGSPDCPWLVQVHPGQRINLTLVNFGWRHETSSQQSGNGETEGCTVYGTIKEETAPRSKTVCSGRGREQHVYTSLTNSVELRIVGQGVDEKSPHFLFRYEALGCADPSPPQGGWMRRVADLVTMGCNSSRHTWELKCHDKVWEGEVSTCSEAKASAALGSVQFGKISIPYGISIVIVILVAVIVGALILTVGLVIVKRHYSNKRRQEAPYSIPKDTPAYKDSMYMSTQPHILSQNKSHDTLQHQKQLNGPIDNSYTHIWERPLPEPNRDCTCPSSPYGTQNRPEVPCYDYNTLNAMDTGTGHAGTLRREFYGNNTMARRDIEPDSGSEEDPRYFSLDPDGSKREQI